MAFRKNKTTNKWEFDYKDIKGKRQIKKGFKTKAEAEQAYTKLTEELRQGVAVNNKITFREAAETFMRLHVEVNCKPSTKEGYESYLKNHLNPFFGDMKLNEITPILIKEFIKQKLETGRLNSTVNKYTKLISEIYSFMIDNDVVNKNPLARIKSLKETKNDKIRALSTEEVQALLSKTIAYFVNDLALILSLPLLVIIGSYSYFKRFSYLAHIILGISLALAPIAGVVAVSETIPLWVIFLSIGVMFWVAGFDLLYSLQDIDVDKKLGLHSIPSKFGAKKTMLFSKVFHFLTIVFWLLFVIYASGSYFAYLAVVISALMLSYEHYLVNKDFRKIDRAFFTVNGYLGIVFFFLVVLDNIFF